MLINMPVRLKIFRVRGWLRFFDRFEEKLSENNALDFDDLLLIMVKLLRQQPALLDSYYQHFRHLLVDEFSRH